MPKKNDGPKKSPKKPKTAKGYKIPERLPQETILTDCFKQQWQIYRSIGYGGFGEIYLVTKEGESSDGVKYVLKLEPYTNGPLFTEINFYKRVGKLDQIKVWMKNKKLNFLGIPYYIGSGSHQYHEEKTRFLVMERFGMDLQKIIDERKQLSKRTVLVIAIRLLDVLEYIHNKDYVHADIKPANVLLGYGAKKVNEIHLLDYGLATKYRTDNGHKEYKEDPRKAHDGTIEYTSIDAHNGVCPSRRSDVQILGYNMLHWLSGTLPWIKNLTDKAFVREQKIKYQDDIAGLMDKCFPKGESHSELENYFEIVMKLNYSQKPPYQELREIFQDGIRTLGPRSNKLSVWTEKESKQISNIADDSSLEQSEEEEMSADDEKPMKRRINSEDEYSPRKLNSPLKTKKGSATRPGSSKIQSPPSTKKSRISTPTKSLLDLSESPTKRTQKTTKQKSKNVTPAVRRSSGAIAKTPNSVKKRPVIRRKRKLVESTSTGTQTTPGLKKMRSVP